MRVIIYPAVDLRRGRAVRLSQGDFEREQAYDADPVARASSFIASGAEWLHVVDLDAAKGDGNNRETVEAIATLGTAVQVGGGVRDANLLHLGASRLVVGSLLLRDRAAARALLEEANGRLAFGLDHRDGQLLVSGWQADSGYTLAEVLEWEEVTRAAALIVTDVSTDGMLEGPNVDSMAEVVRRSPVPVICSGGVGTLDHVKAVRDSEVSGLIIGRALYEKRFSLEDALGAAK